MASDEIMKAYAEYMNSANTNTNINANATTDATATATAANTYAAYVAAQQIQQYQHLQQQQQQQQYQPYYYPVYPTAPEPPPAVTHTVALLSDMPAPPKPPGYVDVPRMYGEKPALAAYSVGWQYAYPNHPPSTMAAASAKATVGGSAPPPRSTSGQIVEAKSQERFHYYEYESGPPPPTNPSPATAAHPPAEATPPLQVLIGHSCSICGQMRSAAFHRSHPIIPGKRPTLGVCRRCEKKQYRSEEDSKRKVTRIRKCTAEEPCDWPDQVISRSRERIGRRRSRSYDREDIHWVRRRSTNREHSARRSESRVHMGLRALQDNPIPKILRRKKEVGVASVSPHRETYVQSNRAVRYESVRNRPSIEYITVSSPREEPLPHPPIRYRAQSASPVRYRSQDKIYLREAVDRIASHPIPYRSIPPDQRAFTQELNESTTPPSPEARRVLKPLGMTQETEYRRRSKVHRSQESTMVEVGGPRVQFGQAHSRVTAGGPSPGTHNTRQHHEGGLRRHDDDEKHLSSEEYANYYYRRAGAATQYLDQMPPRPRPVSPPTRAFEELRIRHVSPHLRGRSQTRYVTAAPRSPSPQSPSPLDRTRIHYRSSYPRSPSPHGERINVSYHNARPALPEREPSPPMLSPRERDWEEVSATDSDDSREVVKVKSWKSIDENGQPVRYFEESRVHYLSERDRDMDERRS